MVFPNHKKLTKEEKELRVKEFFIEDLGKRFEIHDFDSINYSVTLKYIKSKTGVSVRNISSTIRAFLDSEKKSYKVKKGGITGRKYRMKVKRTEYEKWKEKILSSSSAVVCEHSKKPV